MPCEWPHPTRKGKRPDCWQLEPGRYDDWCKGCRAFFAGWRRALVGRELAYAALDRVVERERGVEWFERTIRAIGQRFEVDCHELERYRRLIKEML